MYSTLAQQANVGLLTNSYERRKLADNRAAAVGEHHRAASFDNGRSLRGHDISKGFNPARVEITIREIPRPASRTAEESPAETLSRSLFLSVYTCCCLVITTDPEPSVRMIKTTRFNKQPVDIIRHQWTLCQTKRLLKSHLMMNP